MTYAVHITCRSIAAILGGYVLSSLFAISASKLLVWCSMPVGDAVLLASMLSYIIFFAAFIFAFSNVSTKKIFSYKLSCAALLAVIAVVEFV